MSHLRCLLLTLLTLLISFNIQQQAEVSAGPLSLSFARSFRSGREIRTPFRTNQIMVARGFGKRNVLVVPTKNGIGVALPSGTAATIDGNVDKSTNPAGSSLMTNFGFDGSDGSDGSSSSSNSGDINSVTIDWLANELVANPNLARLILQHFVDFNGDGKITPRELVPNFNAIENFEYY